MDKDTNKKVNLPSNSYSDQDTNNKLLGDMSSYGVADSNNMTLANKSASNAYHYNFNHSDHYEKNYAIHENDQQMYNSNADLYRKDTAESVGGVISNDNTEVIENDTEIIENLHGGTHDILK